MTRSQNCPICSKPVSTETEEGAALFPFCSQRCRQVDLLRWSQGKYSIVEPLDPRHVEDEQPDMEG
jgi:uncharacterized protein